MVDQVQPTQPFRDTAQDVCTVCHGCDGHGAVAIRRAAAVDGQGVRAYQPFYCPVCCGQEWLRAGPPDIDPPGLGPCSCARYRQTASVPCVWRYCR